MEGTKSFGKFLVDISKEVRFYKYDAPQPIYFLKKSMHSEENFNGQTKVLITHIVYRRTTPEAY